MASPSLLSGKTFGAMSSRPCLEGIEDGNAVLLPKAANAIGPRFAVVRRFFLRQPFYPVELLEELERLLRRAATFLSRLEGLDEAPS